MNTKDAADAVWRAFSSGDRQTIHDVLTEDVEWIAPPGNATALALDVTSHMVGKAAISGFLLEDFPRLFGNGMDIKVLSVTSEDDRVVYEQRHCARLSNGRAYDNTYVFIFEMEGRKVRRIREYMDTNAGAAMIFGDNPPGETR